MLLRFKTYHLTLLLLILSCTGLNAQQDSVPSKQKFGPNDTIIVPVFNYNGEILSYRELQEVTVCNCTEEKMNQIKAEWTRLRNAVYVTYPIAITAGKVFNDINTHLQTLDGRRERKDYIKSREKELKKEFSDKLEELSVYQGKVLMKLIYRETNNDCYDILKDQSKGTNYHKVMEYLSTGKVVVSNNITTYKPLPNLVIMTKERDNNDNLPALFKEVINKLDYYNSDDLKIERTQFANSNTYSNKIINIENLLKNINNS